MHEAHDKALTDDFTRGPVMSQQPGVAERALAWVHEKWGDDKKCPMCGHVTWNLSAVGGLLPWKPPDGVTFQFMYLVAPIACTNCGFVAFLDATVAGLRDVPGKETEG